MSGWAIGISTAASLAGTAYSANEAASAQRRSSNANLMGVRETNELNERLFNQSRGSEGSAILPLYLSGFERALGTSAADLALLGFGNPAETVAGYQADVDALRPGTTGSTAAVNDLFTGGTLSTRLGALSPVKTARTNAARTRLESIDAALTETIGKLDAAMARRGFSGGSSFDNRQLFNATSGARQSAAEAAASAELLNAQDEAGIRDSDALMRLQLASLPFDQAARVASLRSLPIAAASERARVAAAPLDFFRLGTQAFQNSPLPQVNPVMSSSGNIGAAIGAAGSSLGNYFAMQNLAQSLNQRSLPQTATPNFNVGTMPALTPIDFNLPQMLPP